MKRFLIAILCLPLIAFADCRQDFDEFKLVASMLVPSSQRQTVLGLHLVVGKISTAADYSAAPSVITTPGSMPSAFVTNTNRTPTDEGSLAGLADYASGTIYVTCNDGAEFDSGVIAHEFGHFVSYFLGRGGDEDDANIFGAEIYFQAHRDTASYLKLIDGYCEQGQQYSCQRARMWRVGLQGG